MSSPAPHEDDQDQPSSPVARRQGSDSPPSKGKGKAAAGSDDEGGGSGDDDAPPRRKQVRLKAASRDMVWESGRGFRLGRDADLVLITFRLVCIVMCIQADDDDDEDDDDEEEDSEEEAERSTAKGQKRVRLSLGSSLCNETFELIVYYGYGHIATQEAEAKSIH